MDLMAIFKLPYDQPNLTIGALLVLILLTGIVLVYRSSRATHPAAEKSTLDVEALESTLKKVLAESGASLGAAAGSNQSSAAVIEDEEEGTTTVSIATANGNGISAESAALIRERDQKIQELQTALEAARKEVNAQQSRPVGGADSGSNELQAKVMELEARLAEYAIIEEDIADLSTYKEENRKLKEEIEKLRGLTSSQATSTIPTPVARPFEKADKFGLDMDDDVMKEFAAAVSAQDVPAPAASAPVEVPASAVDHQSSVDEILAKQNFEAEIDREIDAALAKSASQKETLQSEVDAIFAANQSSTPSVEPAKVEKPASKPVSSSSAARLTEEASTADKMIDAAASEDPFGEFKEEEKKA